MSARRRPSRSKSKSGKLALRVSLITGGVAFFVTVIVAIIVAGKLAGYVLGPEAHDFITKSVFAGKLSGPALAAEAEATINQSYMVAVIMALVAGAIVGFVSFGAASAVAARLTDLSLAVSKLGRGTKAQVRVSGNDEISILGRALSALAAEMAGQTAGAEDGAAVDFDPKIRELRDKALPVHDFSAPQGYEIDAALSAGSRGGTEYFDCKESGDHTALFLISATANTAAGTVAVRMARDEMLRAFGAGASGRKALAHTNRVLHRHMPRGVCATATLVEIGPDTVKLYQAGARVPVLLCSAGELEDLTAEGLALGLDSGPVFEKGLRSNSIEMAPGMRLVVLNDAGNRQDDLVDSIREHSAKHTTAFMNMVLGELEEAAGDGGLREDVVLMTVKRS